MGAFTTSDFASLLDDAIAAAAQDPKPVRRPSIPFDILQTRDDALADATVADAAAEYLFQAAGEFSVAPDLSSLISPELPSIELADIAVELGLTGREHPAALDRLRREFAFANHPDRVAADLRDRAIQRMQIANTMIDEAKRRFARISAGR